MRRVSTAFLTIYSGIVTAAFGFIVVTGFSAQPKKQKFEEIDVQRINVVEPDGKLRLVISDQARFPGSYVKGQEDERTDRKTTGLLFLDNEGTEMGGLIFGGSKDEHGKISSNGHLSFDQYMQDQLFSIDAGREGDKKWSAITISDRGEFPITDVFEFLKKTKGLSQQEKDSAWKAFQQTHPGDHNRLVVGRAPDNSSVIRLKDPEGHDRIVLRVDSNGQPLIQLLDENGKAISQLPPRQ